MTKAKYLLIAMLAILLILPPLAAAKSLYVIANINANPTPIQAYNISGTTITLQATHTVPYHGWGAVGIAVDTDSAFLFLTYEQSNTIELIDATTMTSAGTTTAPGATNLSGIVVDQGKSKVYTIDRTTNHLYVYSWNATTKTLTLDGGTYKTLSGCTNAYGIALDETNGKLYVADRQSTTDGVKIYNTSDWSAAGSFDPCHNPVGIAVDASRGYVYTTAWNSGNLLSRWKLSDSTETTVDLGVGGVGVAVDPATGLVYCTTYSGTGGDNVRVFDLSLTKTDETGDIGDPTGLVVPGKDIAYNPLNFSKSDQGACAQAGQNLTYKLCFDNTNNTTTVHNVTITDPLPAHTTFVSATGGGTYNGGTNTVTWNIGDLAGGAAQQCVYLTVKVDDPLSSSVTTIDNSATIDSDDTPPTTRDIKTKVCGGSITAITTLLMENPCANVINLSLGVPYTGTTVGGTTAWNTYNCSSWSETGPEKVHKVTITKAGRIEAVLSGHTADLDVFILSSCSNTACVAFGDEAAVYANVQPGTYYIAVDGYQGANGPYTLTVFFTDKLIGE